MKKKLLVFCCCIITVFGFCGCSGGTNLDLQDKSENTESTEPMDEETTKRYIEGTYVRVNPRGFGFRNDGDI